MQVFAFNIVHEFVCLSVCLWLALLPFNVNQFWLTLVTRTLLWSSLAATIMVQIGRRGTARRLLEYLKKFFKNHRIRISKFWSIIFCVCLLCIEKKIRLDSNGSRCCLGFGLDEPREACIRLRCTLTQPVEYHWTVRVQRWCGLLSNYFDRLLLFLLLFLLIIILLCRIMFTVFSIVFLFRVAVDDDWTGFRRCGRSFLMIFHFCIFSCDLSANQCTCTCR